MRYAVTAIDETGAFVIPHHINKDFTSRLMVNINASNSRKEFLATHDYVTFHEHNRTLVVFNESHPMFNLFTLTSKVLPIGFDGVGIFGDRRRLHKFYIDLKGQISRMIRYDRDSA
jgi:hypothetical protein